MRWVGIFTLVLLVVLLVVAAMNLLQGWLVDKFTSLGWMELVGLASGRWWENIPIWVLAVAAFLTFIVITRQMIQARKSTNAQLAMDLFRELRSKTVLERLRYIYSLPPKEDGKYLSTIHKDNIDSVLNRLTTLGILVNEGIIDTSLAIEGFSGPAVLRCWYQLFNYIKHLQQERGDYYENYEGFVSYCLKYFNKAHIKVKFNNIENLVTELQKPELRPRSLEEIKKDREKRARAEKIEKHDKDKEKDKKKNTKSMKTEVLMGEASKNK